MLNNPKDKTAMVTTIEPITSLYRRVTKPPTRSQKRLTDVVSVEGPDLRWA